MEEILWVTENSLEQLKTNLLMSSTFFCPNFSSPFVKRHWVRADSSEVFNASCITKQVWLTFLRLTSSPSPVRYLLPNERTWFGKERETVLMPQERTLQPRKMHFLKMASSVFRIWNHYKGLCGVFLLLEGSRWKPYIVLGRCRIPFEDVLAFFCVCVCVCGS